MNELAERRELADVAYYRSDSDPETFFYLPGAPTPQRDPRGRPALTLWLDGAGARLQLGCRWDVAPERLAALKAELLRANPELSPALIRLQPAPLGQVSAELAIGDGAAEPVVIASAPSSGFTPYMALFNVALDEAQRERAVAALHGRPGFLTLAYRGVRADSVTATVTISGEVADDLAQLPAEPSPEACLAQIAEALEAGRLVATRSGDAGAPDELWRRAAEQALARAADELRRLHGAAAPTTEARLHVEVRLSAPAGLPLVARADVAGWFAAGEGAAHVRPLPGGASGVAPPPDPGASPPPAAASVGLAVAPAELPVAFVRLRRGAWSGALRGPAFAAVELPAHATGPLEVTTSYTSGAPYTVTLAAPGPEGLALTAAELGLAEVAVDGRARRDAGAREVRLRLRYRAAGAGSDDDRTVYLRRDVWEARWFLITRAPTLDGELELEWREIGANGAPAWHRPEPIDTTTITL
jgi:hypothetical protein